MFGPVDYKAETTANFSKNSPKLRFTAITYLLENGFYQAGQGNDLIEEAQRICDFVTANVEEFLAELAPDKEDETSGDTTEGAGNNGDGAYL